MLLGEKHRSLYDPYFQNIDGPKYVPRCIICWACTFRVNNLQAWKKAPQEQLSWRLAGMIQTARRLEAINILNGTQSQQTGSFPPSPELENCIRRQLATVGSQTGLSEVSVRVLNQLERTLYDFPCLQGCAEIKDYANSCASLAWACLARPTPLVLDVAQGVDFRREMHARHHGSPNPNGGRIKTVLWPGLREGCQGRCLHRAVVLTN